MIKDKFFIIKVTLGSSINIRFIRSRITKSTGKNSKPNETITRSLFKVPKIVSEAIKLENSFSYNFKVDVYIFLVFWLVLCCLKPQTRTD